MGNNCEVIIDQSGVEVWVYYTMHKEPVQIEEGHGYHIVDGGTSVSLDSVEIVIGNKGINILEKMNENQKQIILDQLSIY